jgi:hypothetical protein
MPILAVISGIIAADKNCNFSVSVQNKENLFSVIFKSFARLIYT